MTSLQLFENPEFGAIRIIEIDGTPWMVGKDVALALGYSDTAKAIRVHVDDEDKGVADLSTPGGVQSFTIINESGLYGLVLSSRLPTAKKFRRWVTGEVLPSIRKNGVYGAELQRLITIKQLRAEHTRWRELEEEFDALTSTARKRYESTRASRDKCRAKVKELEGLLDQELAQIAIEWPEVSI